MTLRPWQRFAAASFDHLVGAVGQRITMTTTPLSQGDFSGVVPGSQVIVTAPQLLPVIAQLSAALPRWQTRAPFVAIAQPRGLH
jgi:hypothetical protein